MRPTRKSNQSKKKGGIMSPAPKDWSEFIRDCKEGKTRNWLIKKYGFKDWGSLRRRVNKLKDKGLLPKDLIIPITI